MGSCSLGTSDLAMVPSAKLTTASTDLVSPSAQAAEAPAGGGAQPVGEGRRWGCSEVPLHQGSGPALDWGWGPV